MPIPRALPRSIVLALSLLSGCAASPSGTTRLAPSGTSQSSRDAFADYLIGKVAGQEGDLRTAAAAFLRATRADPGSPIVAQQAFLTALLVGSPDTEALARAQDDNPLAQLYLANLIARRGDWSEAAQQYDALPHQGITQVLQPLLTAWAQYGADRPDRALATLAPYVEGDRFRGVYALHAAMIADLSQRDPEAARLYHIAEGSFGDLNLDLVRVLASWQARQGNTAQADRLLAALVQDSPDLAIAAPALQRAVAERPVRSAADGIADAYLALAAALQQQDAPDFSALLLRLALQMRPDLTSARLLASELDADAKQPERALRELAPVPSDDPLAALIDLRRATLLDRLGRGGEALTVLARMEKAFPDSVEPWAMQGALLRGQHRYGEAVAAYDQAVQRVPHPARANWPLFYERGIALDKAGRWPEAQADFQHALQLSPNQPFVLNYLAYSWTEQGRHLAEAQRMLEQAEAQQPSDGAIVDSLGWVALHQGKTAEAVKDLERAAELDPEDATINGHLGDAYQAAGRVMEAAYQWRRALTLNPDADEAARLRGKLREAAQVSLPGTASAADGKATP
jgi:tetratricopeptide (TPR) repeat protein